MAGITFTRNMERFRDSILVDPKVDPFYLLMFAVGVAICLLYPASVLVGMMFMSIPMLPVINRTLKGDLDNSFYDDFDEVSLEAFLTDYARYGNLKGLPENDTASDVYTLGTIWASGDAAATIICLMHLSNKMEALVDVSNIQQDGMPPVHPGEDDSGPGGPAVSSPDDGSGLPEGRPSEKST